MIEVYLYGDLKELAKERGPNSSAIMLCEYVEGEHFQDFLHRLGLNLDDVGDCYINNALANPDNVLHDRDTVELNQRA
ncbi:MAG: hypothetical protein ACE5H4_06920 [Candidatus Thorarchaeota archaeon]